MSKKTAPKTKKDNIFKLLTLDERRLSQQWLFRLSIAIPLIISFILCFPLWKETSFYFTSEGYANFLKIFTLPIGVLSLSIPLVAIVAHIHRTIQTETQIQESKVKNTSDIFFSHQKYFIEAILKIPGQKINYNNEQMKINDPYQVYNNFFPYSSYNNGIVSSQLPEKIFKIQEALTSIENEIEKNLNGEIGGNKIKLITSFYEITQKINYIHKELSINLIDRDISNSLIMEKENNIYIKLITKYYDEIHIKDVLKNTFNLTNRVLILLNTAPIDTSDMSFFYYNLHTKKYEIFEDLFASTVTTLDKEVFYISINQDNQENIKNEYENYLKKISL